MQTPQPEDERTPARPGSLAPWSWLLLALTLAWSAYIAFRMFRMHEHWRYLFDALGGMDKVPPLTSVVVSIPFYCTIPFLAILGIIKELLIRDKSVSLALNAMHMFLICALYQIYATEILDPIMMVQIMMRTR